MGPGASWVTVAARRKASPSLGASSAPGRKAPDKWSMYGSTAIICCSRGPGGAQRGRGLACLPSAHLRRLWEVRTHAKTTQTRPRWPLTWDWLGCSRISIFVTCAYK